MSYYTRGQALILSLVVVIFGSIVPNFFLPVNMSDGTRQIGDLGFVVLGMMIVVFVAAVGTSAFVGLINGLLIGVLKLRGFLTTLVMRIGLRALVDTLLLKYAPTISAAGYYYNPLWDFVGAGGVFGIPFSLVQILLTAIGFDVRRVKNRDKILSRVYISPTYFALPAPPATEMGSG